MYPRRPLPEALQDIPFTILDGAVAGVSRARLEHAGLHRPTYGVRSVRPVMTLADQARALAIALPQDCAFGRETAAELWGLPLSRTWSPGSSLHVMRDGRFSPIRRAGVTASSGLELRVVASRHDLRLTSKLDTWLDLGGTLSLDELVIIGDALIAWRSGRTLSELAKAVADRPSRRTSPALREAQTLVRAGAASPGETRARLVFHRNGLPEPELNAQIVGVDGDLIATCDFVWREPRVIAEYDGDHHRTDVAAWRGDYRRTGDLERLGWRVIRLTADDLRRSDSLVARLAAALGGSGAARVA